VTNPRTAVVALVLALVAGFLLAATAPTYAESSTQTDPAGDPLRTTYGRNGSIAEEAAPGSARLDLVSTTFDYRRRALVVRGTTVALGRGVRATLQVKAGGRTYLIVGQGEGRLGGFVVTPDDVEEFSCRGASSSVDEDRSAYRVRVPARCLGAPERLRAGLTLSTLRTEGRRFVETSDDARRVGGSSSDRSPRLGAALTRG